VTKNRSNILILGIMLLTGALSGFFVYLGIQALGSNDLLNAAMYIGAGIGGFILVGYRIFKTMKVSQGKSDPTKEVFTTLECTQCDKKIERPFTRGDYIYKKSDPCTDCPGQMVITKIITHEETQ